jgi:hypothetical protein
MNRTEATNRTSAAMVRFTAANPAGSVVYLLAAFVGMLLRAVAHLCVGFGLASVTGQSAWWGLPGALLSGVTLGWLYALAVRGSRVREIEFAADDAENRAVKP